MLRYNYTEAASERATHSPGPGSNFETKQRAFWDAMTERGGLPCATMNYAHQIKIADLDPGACCAFGTNSRQAAN